MKKLILVYILISVSGVYSQNTPSFQFGLFKEKLTLSPSSKDNWLYYELDSVNYLTIELNDFSAVYDTVMDPTGKRFPIVYSDSIFQLTYVHDFSEENALLISLFLPDFPNCKLWAVYDVILQNERHHGIRTPLVSPDELTNYFNKEIATFKNGLIKIYSFSIYNNDVQIGALNVGNLGVKF